MFRWMWWWVTGFTTGKLKCALIVFSGNTISFYSPQLRRLTLLILFLSRSIHSWSKGMLCLFWAYHSSILSLRVTFVTALTHHGLYSRQDPPLQSCSIPQKTPRFQLNIYGNFTITSPIFFLSANSQPQISSLNPLFPTLFFACCCSISALPRWSSLALCYFPIFTGKPSHKNGSTSTICYIFHFRFAIFHINFETEFEFFADDGVLVMLDIVEIRFTKLFAFFPNKVYLLLFQLLLQFYAFDNYLAGVQIYFLFIHIQNCTIPSLLIII